jgi:hypothetical protein
MDGTLLDSDLDEPQLSWYWIPPWYGYFALYKLLYFYLLLTPTCCLSLATTTYAPNLSPTPLPSHTPKNPKPQISRSIILLSFMPFPCALYFVVSMSSARLPSPQRHNNALLSLHFLTFVFFRLVLLLKAYSSSYLSEVASCPCVW